MIIHPLAYIVPHWDSHDNAQVYVEQPDGSYLDTYNERTVCKSFVESIVAAHPETLVKPEIIVHETRIPALEVSR